MSDIIERSWKEVKLDIPGVTVKEHSFADNKPNIFIIKNNSSVDVYVSDYPGVNTEDFEVNVPPKGQRIYQKPKVTEKLYFFASTEADIHISSFKGVFDQDSIHQTQEIVTRADLSKVFVEGGSLTIGDGEPILVEMIQDTEGTKNLGSVKISGELPAGDNVIGAVSVTNQPTEIAVNNLPVEGANYLKLESLTGAETLQVKATPGKVFKVIPVGAIVPTIYDDVNQAWLEGSFESEKGLICNTSINIHFDIAGVVWVLYQ